MDLEEVFALTKSCSPGSTRENDSNSEEEEADELESANVESVQGYAGSSSSTTSERGNDTSAEGILDTLNIEVDAEGDELDTDATSHNLEVPQASILSSASQGYHPEADEPGLFR